MIANVLNYSAKEPHWQGVRRVFRGDGRHLCVAQVGPLPGVGNGTPMQPKTETSIDELVKGRSEKNNELLMRLREDEHADHLLQACWADAECGRMECPRKLQFEELLDYNFSPRFGVLQGWLAA